MQIQACYINVTNKDTLHLFAVEEKLSNSEENTNEEFDDYSYLYNIQGESENPIMIEIEIENQPVCMEIDTGSGKSIISENLYKDKFSNLSLKQSSLSFVTYTKEEIKPLGYLDVEAGPIWKPVIYTTLVCHQN